MTAAPAFQVKSHPLHKTSMKTLLLTFTPPSAIGTKDSRYVFQIWMVFHALDMLTVTESVYVCLIYDQLKLQASEATFKATGQFPLSTIITGFTATLGKALDKIPNPRVCYYLFCSIETTTSSCLSTHLLCFSHQSHHTLPASSPLYSFHFPSTIQPFRSLISEILLAIITPKNLFQS